MRNKRNATEQIVAAVKRAEMGLPVADLVLRLGHGGQRSAVIWVIRITAFFAIMPISASIPRIATKPSGFPNSSGAPTTPMRPRGDYWKFGLPMMIWFFIVAVFLVPLIWSF